MQNCSCVDPTLHKVINVQERDRNVREIHDLEHLFELRLSSASKYTTSNI